VGNCGDKPYKTHELDGNMGVEKYLTGIKITGEI